MDRRYFLSTSLMAVAAVTGATAEASPLMMLASPASRSKALLFSEAGFRSQLGSRFDFAGDEWRGPLQLTEVVARTIDPKVEQFTTLFQSAGKVAPAAGVYEVNHPELGRFTLRIDGHSESDRRQAIFALLRG